MLTLNLSSRRLYKLQATFSWHAVWAHLLSNIFSGKRHLVSSVQVPCNDKVCIDSPGPGPGNDFHSRIYIGIQAICPGNIPRVPRMVPGNRISNAWISFLLWFWPVFLQAYTWFLDWLGKTAANKAQHVAVRYANAKAHHVYRILNEVVNWQLEL